MSFNQFWNWEMLRDGWGVGRLMKINKEQEITEKKGLQSW